MNSSASACAVEGLHLLLACRELQLLEQQVDVQLGVGIAQRLGDRDLVQVREDARAAVAHCLQRAGRGTDDEIAGQHGIGLLGVDAGLVQALGMARHAHEAQHRAALLREAHEVEHARGLALEVRGHRDQRAHGHHAGAADAGDQQVVGRVVPVVASGCGSAARASTASFSRCSAPLLRRSERAGHAHKLGQKPWAHE